MEKQRENVFYIDLNEVSTKEEFHKALIRELPLPDYYGENLDALYDVLTEYGDGWNIIFYNSTALEKEEPKMFEGLRKTIKYALEECEGLKIRIFP